MKTTFVNGACVIVESSGLKIICDPWLTGETYYGSWSIYPPLQIDDKILQDIDLIYVSHIHPDHLHGLSLDKINKDAPVIIHSFEEKFVKFKLEKMGRRVIELKHGEKHDCGDGVGIHIYAADNCDTNNSTSFLGLGKSVAPPDESTGIDTVCVIENGKKVVLNVNDCPFELTHSTVKRIMNIFGKPDLLLFPYNAAGSYPQCFENYSNEEKLLQASHKSQKFLDMGLQYLNLCEPKYYLPFAGGYTLCGSLTDLNNFRGNPDAKTAFEYYKNKYDSGKGILLNQLESFDLNTGNVSKKYSSPCPKDKMKYSEEVLKNKKYDYECDPEVSLDTILTLIPDSHNRFIKKAEELNFITDKNIYIELPELKMVKIDVKRKEYKIIDKSDFNDNKYVIHKLDFKLLYRILRGPQYAHWDNATVGSHIQFYRKPDVYEKKIHWCMNYFHS